MTLVQGDYSQIEARLLAWEAAGRPAERAQIDPARTPLIDAFLSGRDPYVEMASEVLQKPPDSVTPEERQVMGKVPMLASLYRITPKGLQEYAWREWQIVWDRQTAEHICASFYRKWPEIARYHDMQARIISKTGIVRSAVGRLRRLPDALGGEKQYEAINAGINFPIQNVATDITLAAAILWEKDRLLFCDAPEHADLVGFVHDALILETLEENARPAAERLRDIMLRAPYALKLGLPENYIRVDIKIGPWGSGAKA